MKKKWDIEFLQFRLEKSNMDIEMKREKLNEDNSELSSINEKIDWYESIKSALYLSDIQEIAVIEERLKLKPDASALKQLNKTKEEIKQLSSEIDNLENIENEYQSKIKELPDHECLKSIQTINFTQLSTFQLDFEKKYFSKILFDLLEQLNIADTDLAKITIIADFSAWWNEGCSEFLKNRIKDSLPEKTITLIRDFRNKIVHGLDFEENFNKIQMYSKSIELTASSLKFLLTILQNEKENIFNSTVIFQNSLISDEIKKCQMDLANSISAIEEISSNRDDSGRQTVPLLERQVDIFIHSVKSSKKIIEYIYIEFTKDFPKGGYAYIINCFLHDYDFTDLNYNDKEMFKIKLKYDGLLQMLGQIIGNLQQYKELIPDIESLGISKKGLNILNDFVALIKDYRNIRTHNLYEHPILLKTILSIIYQDHASVTDQLQKLFEQVKQKCTRHPDKDFKDLGVKFEINSDIIENKDINCNLM